MGPHGGPWGPMGATWVPVGPHGHRMGPFGPPRAPHGAAYDIYSTWMPPRMTVKRCDDYSSTPSNGNSQLQSCTEGPVTIYPIALGTDCGNRAGRKDHRRHGIQRHGCRHPLLALCKCIKHMRHIVRLLAWSVFLLL